MLLFRAGRTLSPSSRRHTAIDERIVQILTNKQRIFDAFADKVRCGGAGRSGLQPRDYGPDRVE